jgi:hypothetical protein
VLPRFNVVLFWSHVDKNGPVPAHRQDLERCWVWKAHRHKGTYGRFGVGSMKDDTRSVEPAHRVAFAIKHGRWPTPCALHHCDNTACVRPSHLFEGDRTVNNADRDAKGRTVARSATGRYGDNRKTEPGTHCKRGHEFNVTNTYYWRGSKRRCRICRRQREGIVS